MFNFLKATTLKKDHLKGTAKLLFQDVSEEAWDRENLTKEKLDFTMDSLRYIDQYAVNLLNTENGTQLLSKHFENFSSRIGAYIGEVIKSTIQQDFHWYEFESIYKLTTKLDDFDDDDEKQSLLFSKKKDAIILPLLETSQFLKGESSYLTLVNYAEEMVNRNA